MDAKSHLQLLSWLCHCCCNQFHFPGQSQIVRQLTRKIALTYARSIAIIRFVCCLRPSLLPSSPKSQGLVGAAAKNRHCMQNFVNWIKRWSSVGMDCTGFQKNWSAARTIRGSRLGYDWLELYSCFVQLLPQFMADKLYAVRQADGRGCSRYDRIAGMEGGELWWEGIV